MKKNRSRAYQENLVKLAIDVLENQVDPKFGRKRGLKRLCIHKQPNDKYHKILFRAITYLIELRGRNKNDLQEMLKDYYISIYLYFKKFGRIPNLIQFSPSPSNKIRFEEYIYDLTASNREEYWIKEIPEPPIVVNIPIIPENIDSIPSFIEV